MGAVAAKVSCLFSACPGCRGLTVSVTDLLRVDSFSALHSAVLVAEPRQAHIQSHIQLFLGMRIYGWHWPWMLCGCKSEIEGEGGCLRTISSNKAVVVRALSLTNRKRPSDERVEMFETLSYFTLRLRPLAVPN